MALIRFFTQLITHPVYFPILWLSFSWLIWSLLKLRHWPRPTLSIMLIYSAAVMITVVRSWQRIQSCLKIELCYPTFSLLQFVAEVSFWFMVLYVSIVTTLKIKTMFRQNRNWWLALSLIAFAIWHLSIEFMGITHFSSELIASGIVFHTMSWLFFPWLIWLLLKACQLPRPATSIMIIYSVSAGITTIRFWSDAILCENYVRSCRAIFLLPSFLSEVALWFITLYILMTHLTQPVERDEVLAKRRKQIE